MLSSLRSRLTFANVTSCLALFIALGGTSVAAVSLKKNSVGSTQVKNGSLTLKDLKASEVKKLRGKNGATGPIGPAGASGSAGAPGSQGPAGASAATKVVLRGESVPMTNGTTSVGRSPMCQPGERAVSGGVTVATTSTGAPSNASGDRFEPRGPVKLVGNADFPAFPGDTATGWGANFAPATNTGGGRSAVFTVVCLAP